jgi:hypothetical protein
MIVSKSGLHFKAFTNWQSDRENQLGSTQRLSENASQASEPAQHEYVGALELGALECCATNPICGPFQPKLAWRIRGDIPWVSIY